MTEYESAISRGPATLTEQKRERAIRSEERR